jgi:hypothetical protein
MSNRILVIGAGDDVKTSLILQKIREEYGEDVVLYTPEEAREQGLKPEDFGNTSYKITAPPPMETMETPLILGNVPTGRDKRRKRRKEERRAKKRRG